MNLSECLEQTTKLLQEKGIPFALAGGLAASLYRKEPRLTGDVDFALATEGAGVSDAKDIVHKLGFHAGLLRQADLDGGPLFAIKKKNTPIVMVIGREKGNAMGVGTDLLLPRIPWVSFAVQRAQEHQVDFGFGPLPVLTVEDVILAKCFALSKNASRLKDLDDLQSVLEAGHPLDLVYIRAQLENLGIHFSKSRNRHFPDIIWKMLGR